MSVSGIYRLWVQLFISKRKIVLFLLSKVTWSDLFNATVMYCLLQAVIYFLVRQHFFVKSEHIDVSLLIVGRFVRKGKGTLLAKVQWISISYFFFDQWFWEIISFCKNRIIWKSVNIISLRLDIYGLKQDTELWEDFSFSAYTVLSDSQLEHFYSLDGHEPTRCFGKKSKVHPEARGKCFNPFIAARPFPGNLPLCVLGVNESLMVSDHVPTVWKETSSLKRKRNSLR